MNNFLQYNLGMPKHHVKCFCKNCGAADWIEYDGCTCAQCDQEGVKYDILEMMSHAEFSADACHGYICDCKTVDSEAATCKTYIHQRDKYWHWENCNCEICSGLINPRDWENDQLVSDKYDEYISQSGDRDGPPMDFELFKNEYFRDRIDEYQCECPIHDLELWYAELQKLIYGDGGDPWGEIIARIESATGLFWTIRKDPEGLMTIHSDQENPGFIIPVINLEDAQWAADENDAQPPTVESQKIDESDVEIIDSWECDCGHTSIKLLKLSCDKYEIIMSGVLNESKTYQFADNPVWVFFRDIGFLSYECDSYDHDPSLWEN